MGCLFFMSQGLIEAPQLVMHRSVMVAWQRQLIFGFGLSRFMKLRVDRPQIAVYAEICRIDLSRFLQIRLRLFRLIFREISVAEIVQSSGMLRINGQLRL
jgi:hypothetical protein